MTPAEAMGDDGAPVVTIPATFALLPTINGNPIRQLIRPEQQAELTYPQGKPVLKVPEGQTFKLASKKPPLHGQERALIVTRQQLAGIGPGTVLTGRWAGFMPPAAQPTEVLASLKNSLSFATSDPDAGTPGLRPPQIGAVHAVLGYWTTASTEPVTVVMPTGTGKTETMLALLCSADIERLLVVVPSDALRDQIARKFESLGVLPQLGIIPAASLMPIVGRIEHGFKDAQTAVEFANTCNVVVATASAMNASSPEVRNAFFERFTHLFIDEAHHVAANTWRQIRDDFGSGHVVQFTATPFREDGKRLGGRLIYAFPLKEAQKQGYFAPVNYRAVTQLGNENEALAELAVEQLRSDLAAGLDHLVMARVSQISDAEDVLESYQEIAPEFAPVIIHSGYRPNERKAALEAIRTRASRIIVCVNMLGEGFDLPELKIAAIHDPHKSLGVTLQFIGRFARTAGNSLGEATVVVGRPQGRYDQRLRRLYSEDSDWNQVLKDLSQAAVDVEHELSDFEMAFGSLPEEVSMRSLLPKMSTVVYRTHTNNWDPEVATDFFGEDKLLTNPIAINLNSNIAWLVTENRTPVKWGELRTVEEVTYDLYVLYWDSARQLLYINSSNNASVHEELAAAITGVDTTRITGENVYRVMAHMQRLVPTNVGLLDVRNRSRRFSMHVGADVTEGFPLAEAQTKTKTNIFAVGYEEGERVSVGASLKGRIWSYRAADSLRDWMLWCNEIGTKLIDEGISVDDVMRDFIRPVTVEERPELVALALEWPWEIYANVSEEIKIRHDGSDWPILDTDLDVASFNRTGAIPFRVKTPDWSLDYLLKLEGEMKFEPVGPDGEVRVRNQSYSLASLLNRKGLYLYMEKDGLVVPPGLLLRPPRDIPPYDSAQLRELDWTGIDLRVESQGTERRADSIQARTIAEVLTLEDWDIVIDDDNSGEMADIVALRVFERELRVLLVHCKFATDGTVGARVEDLYEVCGQAQKSARWRRSQSYAFLANLMRRERHRQNTGRNGFVRGDAAKLYEIDSQLPLLRTNFTIAISQPGLTKVGVSDAQCELLASTELYVRETASASLIVFCSP